MTRTLILTRHAKSCWANPDLDDHYRPLNKRGVRSSHALGVWFRERGMTPDQVLSSSSRRTNETFMGLELEASPEFTRSLYHARASQMFEVLSHATGNMVLTLGHNPGIADFASRLANEHPDHPRFIDYPSGATLVLRFDIDDWRQLRWSSGSVVDFVVPRDLLNE